MKEYFVFLCRIHTKCDHGHIDAHRTKTNLFLCMVVSRRFAPREDHRLRVFEIRVLSRIFGIEKRSKRTQKVNIMKSFVIYILHQIRLWRIRAL
jgi:hypothetical protein